MRVVVVTGATAGVGRATARRFAQQGDRVALLARGRDGLDGAAEDVRALGAQALALQVDVADDAAVEAAAQRIEDELGPIDVWVNNAMVGALSPFHEMDPDEFERITQVDYLGTVNGTRAALKRMRPRDAGTIVQVGSSLAYRGIPLQSAYCGSKHAIQGFTESVRCELLHDGSRVHITMVQLPAVNTPQFGHVRNRMAHHPQPVPPIYQPEVAAKAIVWSAGHHARELVVGAMNLAIVVGNAFAPGLGDRYLARTGYDDQQSDLPPSDENYVFEPVPGDHGAHGRFDAEASDASPFTDALMGMLSVVDLARGAVGAVARAVR